MANNVLEDIREIVVAEGLQNKRVNEAILVEKLGVSRTSVREALRHLEEEDLIERRQGSGINLKTPSLKELVEIYDIRILLEGLAARYLTENLSDPVLKELKKASQEFNRVKQMGDNSEKLRTADAKFHQIIIDACSGRRLERFIDNLRIITRSFKIANKVPASVTHQKVTYPHEKVIAALESGNPRKAEDVSRLHIEEGKNNLVKFLLGPGVKLH